MSISKTKRETLRQQFGGCCAFCGTKLPQRGWHAEFIGEEYVKGGMVAVCSECRGAKGNSTPEAFRELLAEQVERAERHSINFRTAIRFGLVSSTETPVVFWFERYSTVSSSTQRSSSYPAINNNSAA